MKTQPVFVATLFLLLIGLALGTNGKAQTQVTPNTLALDPETPRPEATIADVAWIAGHWRGEAFGGLAEEVWSPPLGGTMMGMYRLVQEGKVVFYEILAIVEESNSLVLKLKHFNPDLTGWEEKDEAQTFRLVKVTPTEAYFEGLTFRQPGEDTLQIFLIMRQKDRPAREQGFNYRRWRE